MESFDCALSLLFHALDKEKVDQTPEQNILHHISLSAYRLLILSSLYSLIFPSNLMAIFSTLDRVNEVL